MTANSQVKSLIAELDRLLQIAAEQETATVSSDFLQRLREVLSARDSASSEISPDAIAQAVIERLNAQMTTPLSPSPQEVMALRHQRDTLAREVKNLEDQRQQLISNFLKVLLNHLSEALKKEVSQTLESIESQFLYAIAPSSENASEAAIALTQLPGNPSQRLEQLKYLQQESDRLFMSLDSTFHTVFETLQKDLHSYQKSLSQATARLYDLSQGDRNPTPSEPPSETPLSLPQDWPSQTDETEVVTSERYPSVTPVQLPEHEVMYPFPGIELPPSPQEMQSPSPDPEEDDESQLQPIDVDAMDESEIDALLQLDEVNEAQAFPVSEAWEGSLFGASAVPAMPPEAPPIPSEVPPAPEETVALEEADTAEEQLFGEAPAEPEIPEPELPEAVAVEAELFTEETEPLSEPDATPETPELQGVETAPAVPTTSTTTIPTIKETISSLTELLEQAYVDEDEDSDAELTPFTPVPVGENLWATEETEATSTPVVSNKLDSEQLEQLNEDLQRFQEGGDTDTTQAQMVEGIPAELMGEDLEGVSVESLDSEPEEDMWAETPVEPTSEESEIPTEINPEPWSGSTTAPEGSEENFDRES